MNLEEMFTFDIKAVEIDYNDWEKILTHNKSDLGLEWLNYLVPKLPEKVQAVIKNQESMPVLMTDIKGNIASMNLNGKFPCDNCIPSSLTQRHAAGVRAAVATLKSRRVFLNEQLVQKFEAVCSLQATYIEDRQTYIEQVREKSGGITKFNVVTKIPAVLRLVAGATDHAIAVLEFQDPYIYALMNLLEVAKCLVHDRNTLVEIMLGTAAEVPAQQSIQFYEKNDAKKFVLVAASPQPPKK